MKHNSKLLYLLLIILILIFVLYLCKTNEYYDENITSTKLNNIDYSGLKCLNQTDIDDLQYYINNLELVYINLKSIKKNNLDENTLKSFKIKIQIIINNLLKLFQNITSTQLSCVLNDKNQLDILNKIVNILDKDKEKLRIIKNSLMNDFKNISNISDILPSTKLLQMNKLDIFSKLFNNISYIFNDNDDYTLDDKGNIIDKDGNTIGKHVNLIDNKGNPINKANLYKALSPKTSKICNFMCTNNTLYQNPSADVPQYKELSPVKI